MKKKCIYQKKSLVYVLLVKCTVKIFKKKKKPWIFWVKLALVNRVRAEGHVQGHLIYFHVQLHVSLTHTRPQCEPTG